MKHQRTPNLQSIILFSLVKLSGHTNSEWLCFHLSWVNKTSSSIINHHDHEWCHRIVTISFSLMLRQIVFSVEPDYTSFSKYPFKKDYSGFLIVSKTTTEVHLGSHSVGPDSQDKICFISLYSHTVNAWMCSKVHVVPHRLRGLFPKRKHLWHWYSALQLASEKETRYCQLCSESAQSNQQDTKTQIILYYSVCQANTA